MTLLAIIIGATACALFHAAIAAAICAWKGDRFL